MNWTPLRAAGLVLAAGWLPHACTQEDSATAATALNKAVDTESPEVVDFLFWPTEGWKRIELEAALEQMAK